MHVVECPRLNRAAKTRPIRGHSDHARIRRIGEIRKRSFRRAGSSVLVVQHPIGTVKLEEVNKRADAAFDKLVDILLNPQQKKAAVG